MALSSTAKKLITRTLPHELQVALGQVRWEIRCGLSDRIGRKKAKQLLGQRDLRLNVGCGPVVKPGWVNIDLFPRSPDVLPLDLRRDLPFLDETASIIYAEHVFEHLEYPEEARHFLGEAYRVLQPEGILSLGVPDAEISLKAYASRDAEHFEFDRRWHPDWCDTPMHHVNYTFRQGKEHKYAYDFETLSRIILNAGFCNAERRQFDADLDSEARRIQTVYVNARKSAAPDLESRGL
jgi:predicted SAM-dependent methyltransferase